MLYPPFLFSDAMSDSAPNPELLRSLGRVARGLSALFWGLPATLIIGVGTASAGWFNTFGVLPALVATGLPLFGLWQLTSFQRQERPWRDALDRTLLLALVNCGLCPFLHWWHRMPEQPFFTVVVILLAFTELVFLFNLNLVLARLGAMLPDETLRQETRQFTVFNRYLLATLMLLVVVFLFLSRMPKLPPEVFRVMLFLDRIGMWTLMFLILMPLSMTMALIWKTKEVILDSVFNRHD